MYQCFTIANEQALNKSSFFQDSNIVCIRFSITIFLSYSSTCSLNLSTDLSFIEIITDGKCLSSTSFASSESNSFRHIAISFFNLSILRRLTRLYSSNIRMFCSIAPCCLAVNTNSNRADNLSTNQNMSTFRMNHSSDAKRNIKKKKLPEIDV